MTVTVARNNNILRQRLLRFFARKNCQSQELSNFLNSISQHADILLFGGAIRDIALNGIRSFNSDLDFVFDGDTEHLKNIITKQQLSQHGITKPKIQANKFGGYRVQNEHLDIDIWPIKETWAFKQSLVDYHSMASLLNTTITNWDAILFSWQRKKLIYPKHYFEHLNSGYLDIVLDVNPNELGLLVRILRHFVLKEANIFSQQLSNIVYQKLLKYDFNTIHYQEQLSYGENYITPNLILYLQETLSQHLHSNGPVTLDKFNKTLPLF